MTIKVILAAAFLAGTAALPAATLSMSTAVQSQPDAGSAVIEVLKAGSEQPPPAASAAPAPAGWLAVDVAGPFEGYVKNRDLTKQLDLIPGATIRLAPKDGAGVLAVFQKGDKAEITGLHGSWTQIRLEKSLVGYIQTGAVLATAPAAATSPAPTPVAAAPAPPAPPAAAPAPPAPGDEDIALSRLFEGTLASTRSLLAPKRPYPWQLNDPDGKRIAFLDLSKLLLTDQIENYAGHSVVVLGSLHRVKDTPDLVIDAEGLRLK